MATPAAIILGSPTSRREDGRTIVSCRISLPGKAPQEVWLKVDGDAVGDRNDAFAALALLPAMRLKVPVISEGPVSRTLLETGLPAVQRVYRIWNRDRYTNARFHPVEIQAPAVDDLPSGTRAGLFFSGGVDSCFSLLDARDQVDTLVYIRDFEGVHPPEDAERATRAIENVAAAYGKDLVVTETNARPVFEKCVSYLYQHGSLLAAIALELQGRLSFIRVASAGDVRTISPGGSQAFVVPLWSTGGLSMIPDRLDVTRFEKVAAIAEDRVLLQNLRACWLPRHNCGHCHKCVRLMVHLQALDRYEQGCPIDRPPLTPREISRLWLTRNDEYDHYYAEVEDFLADTGRHPEILAALRIARSGRYYTPVGQFFRGDLRKRLRGKARRTIAQLSGRRVG